MDEARYTLGPNVHPMDRGHDSGGNHYRSIFRCARKEGTLNHSSVKRRTSHRKSSSTVLAGVDALGGPEEPGRASAYHHQRHLDGPIFRAPIFRKSAANVLQAFREYVQNDQFDDCNLTGVLIKKSIQNDNIMLRFDPPPGHG